MDEVAAEWDFIVGNAECFCRARLHQSHHGQDLRLGKRALRVDLIFGEVTIKFIPEPPAGLYGSGIKPVGTW